MNIYPDKLFQAIKAGYVDDFYNILSKLGRDFDDVFNDYDENILMAAASSNQYALAEIIVKSELIDVKNTNSLGHTALTLIIKNRKSDFNYDFIGLLSDSVNISDKQGFSPLIYAVKGAGAFGANRGNFKIIRKLRSLGADLFHKDIYGQTALKHAEIGNYRSRNFVNENIINYLKKEMLAEVAMEKFNENYYYSFSEGDLSVHRI